MNTELSHIFNIEILTTLNQTHAINALRQWLMAFEINPSFMQVSTLLSQVCHARYDRMAQLVIGKWIIRRYQNRLYLETNLSKNCPDQLPYHGKTISWGPTIIYPKHFTPHPDIKPQDRCHLAQRQGGERIKWLGRPSQSVKKLFQHYKIPPWQRACHPILYINSIPRALYLPQYHHENHIFELDHV